jgi:23S rRNA (cytosine1962-C5)-methyltransferase
MPWMNKLSSINSPSEKKIAIRVTPAAERLIREGHPWLFAGSIHKQSHEGRAGDLAVIFDRKGRFLAVGLFDPASPIRVRILQQGQPATINQAWFAGRLENAAGLRSSLPKTQTNGYRLVHGENDGLPGLVIDRYAGTYVIKLYTLAWVPHLIPLLDALLEQTKVASVVLRLGRLIQDVAKSNYDLLDGNLLFGDPIDGEVIFLENGLLFAADVINGQKTGFFLDQRENRMRVEKLAVGKDVLNVFAYTGGFSLYAARGGANRVASLDLSQPALEAAERNFQRNHETQGIRGGTHELFRGDAFILLKELAEQGRRFDIVILDPPSFAQRKSQIPRALESYRRLNILGLSVLNPGGILVTASCSNRVTAEDFFGIVYNAAVNKGRPLTEIERTGHGIDHPIGFQEGAYLKCLFARIG